PVRPRGGPVGRAAGGAAAAVAGQRPAGPQLQLRGGLRLLRAVAGGQRAVRLGGGRGGRPGDLVPAARPLAGLLAAGVLDALDVAAPLPRSGGVRLRPVLRLLPRPDLRRGAAPAPAAAAV